MRQSISIKVFSYVLLTLLVKNISTTELKTGDEQILIERSIRPEVNPFICPSETQDQQQLFPTPRDLIIERSLNVGGNIIINNNQPSGAGCLIFVKSRGTNGKVQNNDELGCIDFLGFDAFREAARIEVDVDGQTGPGLVPGRIEFFTAPPIVDSPVFERMRITATGFVGIGTTIPFAQLDVVGTPINFFTLAERGRTNTALSSVFIVGNFAYTITQNFLLQIYDISDPNNIISLGSTTTNLTDPIAVYVQNNIAYVINNTPNSLVLFDVSNPNAIVPLGTAPLSAVPQSLFVVGNFAYVVVGTPGSLVILDVTDPHLIIQRSSTSTFLNLPTSVFVLGNFAYVTDVNNGNLVIYDVSNPNTIVPISQTTTGLTSPFEVFVSGNFAYVVDGNGSFVIFDVTNPNAVMLKSSTHTGATSPRIFVYNNIAYILDPFVDRLLLFDVSNPVSPQLIAQTSQGLTTPDNIFVSGNFIYIADGSGLVIFNVPLAFYVNKNGSLAGNVDISGDLNVGRGALFADVFTRRVGINTVFPCATLDVDGSECISNQLMISGTLFIGGDLDVMGNLVVTGSTISSVLTTATKSFIISSSGNDANAFCLIFQKSRAGGIVQNGDELGCIEFQGFDTFQDAAIIEANVDGIPSAGSMPGRLVFLTTPLNSTTSFERMRITSTGNVGIGITDPAAQLALSGGLHVGGSSDAGATNAQVDGLTGIGFPPAGGAKLSINGGLHVGAVSDPGFGNVQVDHNFGINFDPGASVATSLTVNGGVHVGSQVNPGFGNIQASNNINTHGTVFAKLGHGIFNQNVNFNILNTSLNVIGTTVNPSVATAVSYGIVNADGNRGSGNYSNDWSSAFDDINMIYFINFLPGFIDNPTVLVMAQSEMCFINMQTISGNGFTFIMGVMDEEDFVPVVSKTSSGFFFMAIGNKATTP